MARVSGVQRDSLLVKERVPMAIKGRSERRKLKTAAQDQPLQTEYHATKILQTEREGKCRP